MELYVNPQITGFRQEVDGTIKELKIGSKKEDAWANIAEQGASAKLENNKAATINVSTYTEPVVVTPTRGKDGMKKATITLSNIPSPSGGDTLYYWDIVVGEVSSNAYLNINNTPETASGNDILRFDGNTIEGFQICPELLPDAVYTKISDTSFSILLEESGETVTATYTRDNTKDVTLWQVTE